MKRAQPEGLSSDSPLIEQAIRWRVTLESGFATAADERACADWRAADTRHEQVWQMLGSIGERLRVLPPPLAHHALDRHRHDGPVDTRRRTLLSTGLAVTALGGLGFASRDWRGWAALLADETTAVGERRRLLLADGTQVDLNTDTAIDARYSATQRLLRLRRGEIIVATGHAVADDAIRRPLVVATDAGLIRALGTRFRVRRLDGGTEVDVFDGAVDVTPRDGGPAQRLQAGEGARFDAGSVASPTPLRTESAAWLEGLLIARDQRLDRFVAELDRHRPGVLRCDPAVAALHISGVFPLDDSDAVLAALERTLPVSVQRRGRWWLTVVRRES